MMPKIRVSPAASMNSSSPYCTLFRSWMRKLAKSMEAGRCGRASSCHAGPDPASMRRPRGSRAEPGMVSGELAARARIGQRLGGDADHLVVALFHAAQVDVLDRVVGLAHGPLAARAV